MTEMTFIKAVNSALHEEMARDDRVIVLGEDVGVGGGVFRATEGLFQKFGRQRVIDTPLAESGIVGMSVGMAVAGLRPVAEIEFSGFSYPAANQLISHAARIRWRSRGRYSCPLVVRLPCGGGFRALEHHSESTESLWIHTPGLKVVCPSNPEEAKGLLLAAIRDPDPVVFCEPISVYRSVKGEVSSRDFTTPIGKARVVREGQDITLISYGACMQVVLEVADVLAKDGLRAEVIDLRTLSPLDFDTIHQSVVKTGRVVIVHEAVQTLGVGAEISARLAERSILFLKAPVARVTGYDIPPPYPASEKMFYPAKERVLDAVRKTLGF